MTVKEIVKLYLRDKKYDGLRKSGECGCLADDLAPCDCISGECEPAYFGRILEVKIVDPTDGIAFCFEEHDFGTVAGWFRIDELERIGNAK